MAPIQVKVIPVNNDYHLDFSKNLLNLLSNNKVRVEMDDRDEKLGYKIREAQTKKIPYQLVVGDKEVENNEVTYRRYGEQKQTTVKVEEFLKLIIEEIEDKK